MREMFEPTTIIAIGMIVSLSIVAYSALKAWHAWLALKERELDAGTGSRTAPDDTPADTSVGAARIEISDLKERIRKLEAIASGVDL